MKQDIEKQKLKHESESESESESEIKWNAILSFTGKQIIAGGIAYDKQTK